MFPSRFARLFIQKNSQPPNGQASLNESPIKETSQVDFSRPEALLHCMSQAICAQHEQGGVVYRQKRGEETHGFSTGRGAPQNGDGRTCARQAEPQEILCYAMRVSDLASLFLFLRGSSSSGSAVTSISGSIGYLTSETN